MYRSNELQTRERFLKRILITITGQRDQKHKCIYTLHKLHIYILLKNTNVLWS